MPRGRAKPPPQLAPSSESDTTAQPSVTKSPFEEQLTDFCADCYADPLAFVLGAWDWPINGEDGPDVWQRDFLIELGEEVKKRPFDGVNAVKPIKSAISSGHGIGKSALFAWVAWWIMSTRPYCQGTITANTNDQLEKKTWAAIRTWGEKCLTRHWFEINSAIMYRKGFRSSWFCAPQSCAEENSEAFAGQHAKNSTSFYLNDEDSAVPDKIHEVEEGGMTDGAPIWIVAGNPTRNTGAFYKIVFGSLRNRWLTHILDSRDCKFSNKPYIQELFEDYGEDSDFFRVRVRGLPPTASELQFIDTARVEDAQRRTVETLPDEPLIAGVDVSGGGSAWTVCRFRRGLDARTLVPIRITGEQTKDRQRVVEVLAERLSLADPAHKIAAMFIDSAFGSPIVERLHMLGYSHVYEVNFGGDSADPHQANKRAYMWNKLKEFLLRGAIPKDDVRLAIDLSGPGFHLDKKNRLVLESKESMQKRNVASPDDGDALALTFAQPVSLAIAPAVAPYVPRSAWG